MKLSSLLFWRGGGRTQIEQIQLKGKSITTSGETTQTNGLKKLCPSGGLIFQVTIKLLQVIIRP